MGVSDVKKEEVGVQSWSSGAGEGSGRSEGVRASQLVEGQQRAGTGVGHAYRKRIKGTEDLQDPGVKGTHSQGTGLGRGNALPMIAPLAAF